MDGSSRPVGDVARKRNLVASLLPGLRCGGGGDAYSTGRSEMDYRALQFLYVFEALTEDGGHVFVADGIKDVLAVLAELNETTVAKDAKLV